MTGDPLARYVVGHDHDGVELAVPTRPLRRRSFPAVLLALGLLAVSTIGALPIVEDLVDVEHGTLLVAWMCAAIAGLFGAVGAWVAVHPKHQRISVTGRTLRLERVRGGEPATVVHLASVRQVRTDPTGLWVETRDSDPVHVELPEWRPDEREALAELVRAGIDRARHSAGSAAEVPPELGRLRSDRTRQPVVE